ncbi:hypothetical protein FOZ63_014332, partial [Perkinsus olseni]
FKILKLSKKGSKTLCWLKERHERTPRPNCSVEPVSLKVRRSALLYPSPRLKDGKEAVELATGTVVSLDLINADELLSCDSGAFFLRVKTESQSGYLRVSDAPYEEEPILVAASGVPRRFIARRFTEEEVEGRSHRQQSRPAQQPRVRVSQQSRPTQQQQQQPPVRVSQQSRPTQQQQQPPVRVSQQSGPTQQQQPPVWVSQQVRPVYEASSCGWGEQQRWSVPRSPTLGEEQKWTVPRYPSPLKIGDVTDLTPSEISVLRTDTGVEILRRGRLWRISSYPEYARGEIPPWRGLEM